MKLVYYLSEKARKRLFIETGHYPGQVQSLEVDPATLSREDRAFLAERNPRFESQIALSYIDVAVAGGRGTTTRYLERDEVAEDVAALLAAYRDARAAAQTRLDAQADKDIDREIEAYRSWKIERRPDTLNTGMFRKHPRQAEWIAAHAAAVETAERIQAENDAARKRQEAAQAAEKAARLAERAAWAAEHGSSRLRKCVEQGYDCQRLYVVERAAIEHPGYTVDFDDKAAWRSRSAPSEAALDEAKRVGGEVVWLTRSPAPDGIDQDLYDEDEECEAVAIRGYLGKYDLLKRI